MNEIVHKLFRLVDAAELIAAELERLRVLKEHELGVQLEYSKDGGEPYVPTGEANEA
jgi:hypothetical protein